MTPLRGRRIPRVRQHDLTDCAAACLSSIASSHGLHLPISRVRQHTGTDRKGTSVLGVVEAAERLGFVAKGVRAGEEALDRVPLPAVAHWNQAGFQHFVVLHQVRTRDVLVMDPADGRVHRLPRESFRAVWTGVLILLAPAADFTPSDQRLSRAARFWTLLRPHRTVLVQALLGAAVYTLLGLSTAIYLQKIVDHVLIDGSRGLLDLMTLAMLVLVAFQIHIGAFKSLLALRTGQKIDAALILAYHRHVLRLPQRFFDTMRVGEMMARVGDAVKIRVFINDLAVDLVVNVLVVVLSLALMFLYSWKLALMVAAAIPLFFLVYALSNRVNRAVQRQMMEEAARLEAHLVESLRAAGTIRRFCVEERTGLRTESLFVGLLETVYRSGRTAILAGSGAELLSRLSVIALLWGGSVLVLAGELTPGTLMSVYALLGYLTGPITALVASNRTMQDALIAADRLFEILDLEREPDGGRIELTAETMGDVEFRGVGFRYGSRAQVFDGLDLELRKGRVTAVVGASGSGKSTLASLLQGLYRPTSGIIRIGGVDLREFDTDSVRRRIAAVPQEVELLSGSVATNVALGDVEPDMLRVLRACESVGIREVVEALPAGFATPLGEHGVELSGGERQRLAIARALYREPDILILDEATSNLDPLSEAGVQRAIAEFHAGGGTVLLIAHRLSTVVGADTIVVLEGGRVVEQGSHADLMARDGPYARLWRGGGGRAGCACGAAGRDSPDPPPSPPAQGAQVAVPALA